jgi:hypothetical protein
MEELCLNTSEFKAKKEQERTSKWVESTRVQEHDH